MTAESGLLQVWNPLRRPATIQEHVQILKRWKSTKDQRYVWWGKLIGGGRPAPVDAAEARARWPDVQAVASRSTDKGRELVLLVTDFVSLHALRVSEVRLGGACPEEAHAPRYLWEARAGVWFKVHDIRALRHHQLDTLAYLEEHVRCGPEGGLRAFDAYASSGHTYPIEVLAPGVEETFGGETWFAKPGVVMPVHVEAAMRDAQEALPGLWKRLEPDTQHFLASALVVRYALERSEGRATERDHSPVLTCIARAFEWEWQRLLGMLKTLNIVGAGEYGSIGQAVSKLKESKSDGLKRTQPRTAELIDAACSDWGAFITRLTVARNDSAHVRKTRRLPKERMEEIWTAVFPEGRAASAVQPLVDAKNEAERVLQRTQL